MGNGDKREDLDPRSREVIRKLLDAGWMGEPVLDAFRFGDKIYLNWKTDESRIGRA